MAKEQDELLDKPEASVLLSITVPASLKTRFDHLVSVGNKAGKAIRPSAVIALEGFVRRGEKALGISQQNGQSGED